MIVHRSTALIVMIAAMFAGVIAAHIAIALGY